MKIHNIIQGSVEWALLRSGIPTASEFDNLLTPELEPRKGQMVQTYLARKLAEWWQGAPLDPWEGFDMEQGKILEQEVIPWYELTYGDSVKRPGFISTDDGRFGCSPDGLIGICEGAVCLAMKGVEIKCPRIETHIGYLLKGELPKDYRAQVHGSLFITGLKHWKFVSYRRRCPALVLEVEREDESQARILEALENFSLLLERGKKELCELNGGPPKRPQHHTEFYGAKATAIPTPEYQDMIS